MYMLNIHMVLSIACGRELKLGPGNWKLVIYGYVIPGQFGKGEGEMKSKGIKGRM